MINKRELLLFLCFLCISTTVLIAQNNIQVQGRVVDAATKEGIPFVNILIVGTIKGTTSDIDGFFSLDDNADIKELKVSAVGYETLQYGVPSEEKSLVIELKESNAMLKEVVVKPKKYRNKNNPAVELIRHVIDNRKNNRIEGFESYHVEQYEKILMGFTDLSDKIKNQKMLRAFRVMTENTDTTLLKGSGITPFFMQESLQDFYSQRKPKRSKIWVNAEQKTKYVFGDNEVIDKQMRYIYQDADIYDDYVVLLTDHFISPIADNAPIFYRYYPVDTSIVEGSKIVRLQFFPRNKTDLLLQGELFIALDSTYPVTRISYTVNPNINLNWVRTLEIEQNFAKHSSGKWLLSEESYVFDFGVMRKGFGLFAKRFVSHKNPDLGVALSDTVFQKSFELRSLRPNAVTNRDTTFWAESRHTSLTDVEANTYEVMDSVQNTMFFKRTLSIFQKIIIGHFTPVPGLEIGRINTFYSFNPVEGNRIRFGARTNPDFSKKVNFEGYAAYGFRDKRWKYGLAANISLAKDRAYNKFPYNMIRVNYQQDLLTPGVLLLGTFAPSSLATSFTRGTNDRFFFQKKFVLQYEREYYNHFSYAVGFEHRDLAPLGSLQYVPTDSLTVNANNVRTATPYVQLRFAPEEVFYQSRTGWRTRLSFDNITTFRYARGIKGIGGSQYDYDEFTASFYKFSNIPPIGYNYFYIEGGLISGKVPYPLLTVHRANQTYGYRFMAYNLMNFMEFVSDRYVSINMEHNFYGFFLNKIPLVRKLKLREYITCKVLYGAISEQNKPTEGSGLFQLPTYSDGRPLTYSLEAKPYIEASVGLGNIFKVIRLDLIRRFTYLDHPETNKYGVRVAAAVQF